MRCFLVLEGDFKGGPAQNSGETVANRGRVENLRPWPKGVSGNAAGRPKNDLARQIAQAVFEQNPEAIYKALVRKLLKGDAHLFKQLADRAYGKVTNTLELDVSAEMIVERLEAARQLFFHPVKCSSCGSDVRLDVRIEGQNVDVDPWV
jgi:hypothetical protein